MKTSKSFDHDTVHILKEFGKKNTPQIESNPICGVKTRFMGLALAEPDLWF